MKILPFLLLMAFAIPLAAQQNSSSCDRLIKEAKDFERNGQFRQAIQKYNSAKVACGASQNKTIDAYILQVFDKIEAQKNRAVEAEKALGQEKIRVEKERDRALLAEEKALRETERAEKSSLVNFNVALALNTVRSNPTLALRLAEANYVRNPSETVAEATYFQILGDTSLRFYEREYPAGAPVICLASNPEGTLAAAGLYNGQVILWRLDAPNVEPEVIYDFDYQVNALRFSPDGRYFLAGGTDGIMVLWTVSNFKTPILEKSPMDDSILSACFTPDGKDIYYSLEGTGVIYRANFDNPEINVDTFIYGSPLSGELALSPDGKYVATSNMLGEIRVWETASPGQPLAILNGHKERVQALRFSPDGQYLFSGAWDGLIQQWDIQSPQAPLHTYQGDGNRVYALSFHPEGNLFLSGGIDQTVKLWTPGNSTPLYTYSGNTAPTRAVHFVASGSEFWSGCENGTLKKWSIFARPPRLQSVNAHSGTITGLFFSSQHHCLLSTGLDGKIRRWDANLNLRDDRDVHDGRILLADFNEKTGAGLSFGADNLFKTWQLKDSLIVTGQIAPKQSTPFALKIAPSGRLVAVSWSDSTAWIAKAGTPDQALFSFPGGHGRILSFAFTADEKSIYSSHQDGSIRQWALRGNQPELTHAWYGHWSEVAALYLAQNGKQLISIGTDRRIRLWDIGDSIVLNSSLELSRLPSNVLTFLALAPDESAFATVAATTGSRTELGIFQRTGAREPFWVYPKDTCLATAAVYEPKGNFLYVALEDGRIEKRATPQWFIDNRVARNTEDELLYNGLRVDTAYLIRKANNASLSAKARYFQQCRDLETSLKLWQQAVKSTPSPENYLGLYRVEEALGKERLDWYLSKDSVVVQAFADYFRSTGNWEKARMFYERLLPMAKTPKEFGDVIINLYDVRTRGGIRFNRDSFFNFESPDIYDQLFYPLTVERSNTWSLNQSTVLSQDVLLMLQKRALGLEADGRMDADAQLFTDFFSAIYLYQLGIIAFQEREYEKALTYFEQSFERFAPKGELFIHHKPVILVLLGRPEEARGAAESLLAYFETPERQQMFKDDINKTLNTVMKGGWVTTARRKQLQEFLGWLSNP